MTNRIGTCISSFKDQKLFRSHNTVEIKVFLDFCLYVYVRIWMKIRIRTNNYESLAEFIPDKHLHEEYVDIFKNRISRYFCVNFVL
jgi:hypothetical protein